MAFLLSLRDGLSRFYGKHEISIRILLKFILALIVFCAINLLLGQMAILKNPVVVVAMAAVCGFLPSNSMLLLGSVQIMLHFYGISLEAALAGGGMLMVGMLLYFSIAPQSAMPLIFGAIGTGLGIPASVSVLFGLIGGPLSAIGIGFGAVVFSVIRSVGTLGGTISSDAADAADAMVEKMIILINAVITDKKMILLALTMVIVLWIVWIFRSIPIRFSWMLATVVGLCCYAGAMIPLAGMLGLTADLKMLGIDMLLAVIIAWLAQTFLFSLDFKRTEEIRFSDDEYYYFVKAVPKKKIRRKKRNRRSERR